jgi:hypothetical protein
MLTSMRADSQLARYLPLLSAGLLIPSAAFVGAKAGEWLDAQQGSTFWIPTLGLLGFIGAMVQLYRVAKKFQDEA